MVPRNLTCFTRLIFLSSIVDVGVGGQTREIERHFVGPWKRNMIIRFFMPVGSKKVAFFLEKCHLLYLEYEKVAKVVCHLVHLVPLDHNMVLVDQLSSIKQLQGEQYLSLIKKNRMFWSSFGENWQDCLEHILLCKYTTYLKSGIYHQPISTVFTWRWSRSYFSVRTTT